MTNVYPLHPDTQEVATMLVNAWQTDEIESYFELVYYSKLGNSRGVNWGVGIVNDKLPAPKLGSIKELEKYDLITVEDSITTGGHRKIAVTLLQELINAAEIDFRFTKYRTLQTPQALVLELQKLLAGTIEQNPELKEAIQELEQAGQDEQTRAQKAGKVVTQLGNMLQHSSNFSGTISAIQLIAQFLG